MVKFVCELPQEVQNEIRKDAKKILNQLDLSEAEKAETLENVMNEKLINIIGYEFGLLDADKYEHLIFK